MMDFIFFAKQQIKKMFYANGYQQYKDRGKCSSLYNNMMNCKKNNE